MVDTSDWVEHLRRGNARLRELLHDEQVLCHPFVLGELACGNPRNRAGILTLLGEIPQVQAAEHHEVLHLLEMRRMHGRGIGWVGAHLLASCLLTGCVLWTLDRPLARAAGAFPHAFVPDVIVYRTTFDNLALGETQPEPGDPGQDGWYQALALGDAYGEIEDTVVKCGRALHEFAPASNGCCPQTIDSRNVTPPDLAVHPVITLSTDFYAHTSNLEAMKPYTAVIEAVGGPHPGYTAIGLTINSGNGAPKGEAGVSISISYFVGYENVGIPLTVGQGLAWDTWHHFELAIDQDQDTYLYLDVDGERQDLQGYQPPRSFFEDQWLRGRLIETINCQVIPDPWDPPDESDDDIYWDNLSLTVGGLRAAGMPDGAQPTQSRIVLAPGRPNPFVTGALLHYKLSEPSPVQLAVFDAAGRLIRTLFRGVEGAGIHERTWDGFDDRGARLPSGTYFARLVAGGGIEQRKVVLIQ